MALAAALLWLRLAPELAPNSGHEGAAPMAAPSLELAPARRGQAVGGIDTLLAEGTTEAWRKILALYPGASDDAKRRVFGAISKIGDRDTMLGYLLATVGDDPTPIQDDALMADSAELLKGRWQTAGDFDQGRQTMLLQRSAKRQWLIASAMVAALRDVPEGSPLHPQKARLAAKLVDVHARTPDAFVKSAITDGVKALGEDDAALIMARGATQVSDDELVSVTAKREAREAVE